LPDFERRQQRGRAHWRLFLARSDLSLKHRVYTERQRSVRRAAGSCSTALSSEPWRGSVLGADHRYVPLLMSAPDWFRNAASGPPATGSPRRSQRSNACA
jgi:hypothetical protein